MNLMLKCGGEGVLLILDGFDELPSSIVDADNSLIIGASVYPEQHVWSPVDLLLFSASTDAFLENIGMQKYWVSQMNVKFNSHKKLLRQILRFLLASKYSYSLTLLSHP